MKKRDVSLCLPEELVTQILSLLPVKSLLRFSCVCKSWYVLFENPTFISNHLNNNFNLAAAADSDDDACRLIVQCDTLDCDEEGCFKSLSCKTLNVIHEDLGFRHFNNGLILGCYNGVVCMYKAYDVIVFWNPATRRSKAVPKPEIPTLRSARDGSTIYGFGYDFKTNDYKVVKITPHYIYNMGAKVERTHQIEVYSLSTNSWRHVDAVIPDGILLSCSKRASVNGFESRVTCREREGGDSHICLLTFDMSIEMFICTPMEGDVVNDISESFILTAYKDSVAFITNKVRSETKEIWVLNEYGPNGRWIKLHTIGPFDRLSCGLGLLENGEFLYDNGKGELVMFDPTTRESKTILTDGCFFNVLEYKESLVSLKGGDH